MIFLAFNTVFVSHRLVDKGESERCSLDSPSLGSLSSADKKEDETPKSLDSLSLEYKSEHRVEDLDHAATHPVSSATWTKKTRRNDHLDIGVPIHGQDTNLVDFSTVLGTAIQEFRKHTDDSKTVFRLLITRYPTDDSSDKFRRGLSQKTSLEVDSVIFVTVTENEFHRASAINALQKKTRHQRKSVLVIIDVDMHVGPRFLFNALENVSHKTIYFPIVWSQFRPSNVRLVEKFLGRLPTYSEHRGLWREFGYGMYSISGLDAKEVLMDESFVGWGGEDNDFYSRVKSKNMTIAREEEYGLVHIWHPKYCQLGYFVKRKWYDTW
jgi:hypothetical protein